ncbi:MAG TPA: hypothetical protein VK469_24180, partial [Candidatus Kapabacteria bacterium]|nr:hypothetical protein [Candidatus Kapabacteria bacterium]
VTIRGTGGASSLPLTYQDFPKFLQDGNGTGEKKQFELNCPDFVTGFLKIGLTLCHGNVVSQSKRAYRKCFIVHTREYF